MANANAFAYVRPMTTASALYTKDILRWAASLPPKAALDAMQEGAHGAAERRSASCGSVVRAEVALDGDRIGQAAFDVHACALGQASAAMLLKRAPGLSLADVEAARGTLAAALKDGADWPGAWEELALLERARDYPGRHAALLIGYDALIAAAQDARARSGRSV